MKIPVNIALVVVGAWLFWAMLPKAVTRLGFKVDMATLGQWGDTFGALNAALSAAAVIGVLVTLRLQASELKDQQEQIENQNKRSELAEFETTYFQLLKLAQDLRDKATFEVPTKSRTSGDGRGAFESAAKHLLQKFGDFRVPEAEENLRTWIAKTYEEEVHAYGEHSFGPYFRVLYTILRRIHETTAIPEDRRERYGNIVRSQLSSAELQLIAANALTSASNDFSDYVIEFRLLKYLPEGGYKDALRKVYPAEAFAPRDEVKRRIELLM